jgi:hypothetical protein
MDDRLDRIEQKLDKISDEITIVKITLHGQHISIEEHIERSNRLEIIVQEMQKWRWIVYGGWSVATIVIPIILKAFNLL